MDVGSKQGAQVVRQACAVLFALAGGRSDQTIRGLAEELDISKTTVQRIVVSLTEGGLLTFDPTLQKYGLSHRILTLATQVQQQDVMVRTARPLLEALNRECNETVTLSSLCEDARVTLLQIESSYELRYATRPGHHYPLVLGATGRALLAAMPPARSDELIARYQAGAVDAPKYREADIDYAALRQAVDDVRRHGFAQSRGEWVLGGAGLAVPIKYGDEVYAVGVYGPEQRLAASAVETLAPRLRLIASELGGGAGA